MRDDCFVGIYCASHEVSSTGLSKKKQKQLVKNCCKYLKDISAAIYLSECYYDEELAADKSKGDPRLFISLHLDI